MSDVAGTPVEVYVSARAHGPSEVRVLAEEARRAARSLAPMSLTQRNDALAAVADALEGHGQEILAANAEDLKLADALVATGDLSAANRARLGLTPAKIAEMAEQVRAVRDLPDPLGRVLDAMELDRGLDLEKRSVPLGVLAVVFEARPDAVTQISALALKSGNAVILKPGREVERTATALVELIRRAIATVSLPADAVSLILGREAVAELLTFSSLVDLVIPRGSRALVEHIQATTRIPVLGHADGICHIYVDQAVDAEQALAVIDDAKTDYPAVCNAVETVLIHEAVPRAFLPALIGRLQAKGVSLRGDSALRALLPAELAATIVEVENWHTEYGDLDVGAPECAVARGGDRAHPRTRIRSHGEHLHDGCRGCRTISKRGGCCERDGQCKHALCGWVPVRAGCGGRCLDLADPRPGASWIGRLDDDKVSPARTRADGRRLPRTERAGLYASA